MNPHIIHENLPEMDQRPKWLKEILQAENNEKRRIRISGRKKEQLKVKYE